MEPEKPFACTLPDCGMTFTNEDHLHVHTKKHDMVLQLGMEQKAAFVADQTPTPTRFIRNCEEVGLFQDLQNVNPFDEGFKRAMETKHSILPLDGPPTEDALHTPHLVFPLESGDCTLYTANNQRNITISRSSSDESGAVKEYETTTISKLTNEVTTISRVVKDVPDRNDDEKARTKDRVNETVSYTNNVIKIHSNVEIRKDSNVVNIDNKKELPPIMSQKSLDFVVDSLTYDINEEKDNKNVINKQDSVKSDELKDKSKIDDYEVIIKLPNGKRVRMKAVDEIDKVQSNTKEKLKKVIRNKTETAMNRQHMQSTPLVHNIVPIHAGTLIPVTIVNPTVPLQNLPKIPIVPLPTVKTNFKSVKRKKVDNNNDICKNNKDKINVNDKNDSKYHLNSRNAASKRYRERLKETMRRQSEENKLLRESNQRLTAEKAVLKLIITKHLKKCPIGDDLRNIQEKLQHATQCIEEDTIEDAQRRDLIYLKKVKDNDGPLLGPFINGPNLNTFKHETDTFGPK